MKQIVLIITLLALTTVAYCQTKTPFATTSVPINNRYAWTNNGLWVDSSVMFTKYATSDTSKVLGIDASGRLVLRTKGGASFDTTTIYETIADSAAAIRGDFPSAIDTTSLSDRINLRVKYTDTSSMLSPYLRKIDTITLSNRIDARIKYTDTTTGTGRVLARKEITDSLNNYFRNGGNAFSATSTIGNKGKNNLQLMTRDSVRAMIDSLGNLNIGYLGVPPLAGYKLDVNGFTRIRATPGNNALTIENPSFTGSLKLRATGNSIQRIEGGPGEFIEFGTGGANLISIQSGNTFQTSQFNTTTISGVGTNTVFRLRLLAGDNSPSGVTHNNLFIDGSVTLQNSNSRTNQVVIRPNINLSGNASGGTNNIATGVLYNPILTNIVGLTSHRAWENVVGDMVLNSTSGSTFIGYSNPTTATAKLDVAGDIRTTSPGSNTVALINSGLTTTQINAIPTPSESGLVWDNVLKKWRQYDGTRWTEVGKILSASATLDFPSTAASSTSTLTVTVTGAALNDVVAIGLPSGSVGGQSIYQGYVSAADTVTIRFINANPVSAIDPSSGTFKVKVFKD